MFTCGLFLSNFCFAIFLFLSFLYFVYGFTCLTGFLGSLDTTLLLLRTALPNRFFIYQFFLSDYPAVFQSGGTALHTRHVLESLTLSRLNIQTFLKVAHSP